MQTRSCTSKQTRRRGAASIEIVLVWGVIFGFVAALLPIGIELIQVVYELIVVWVAWPFM